MVLFQTVCHEKSGKIFIILFGVAAVSCLLVFIYNDLRHRTEFAGKMNPHITFAPGRPAVMDYL
jgi:hypothetical protein